MRQVLSIGLVVILMLNLLGFYLSFSFYRVQIKQQKRTELANADERFLSRFEFTSVEFEALERPDGDDREFRIMGEMYDVKRIIPHGNGVTVIAKHDKEDTGLFRDFIAAVSEKHDDGDKRGRIMKLIQQDLFDGLTCLRIAYPGIFICTEQRISDYLATYSPCFFTPPDPS